MPQLFVEGGETIDQVFERVFSDLDQEMKIKLKRQYVTKGKIAESPSRIKKISWDLVNHYTKHIEPNGYKAMLVAPSREAAIIYKNELDNLHAPLSKVIMTSSLGEKGKDGKSWDPYYLTSEQREQESEKFKDPNDPTKILIVVDMLLVGYDAPILQVMYLDNGLREHNLLQAIARVNRPYDEPKDRGLIIDYCGVTKELSKALEIFEEEDVQGVLEPIDSHLEELRLRHLDVMYHFKDLDRNNWDQIIAKFEPVDLRDKFEYDFKAFSKALDKIMPEKEADPYVEDFKFLSKARHIIRTSYEGVQPSARPYAPKIQKLIDDYVRSLDVTNLIGTVDVTYENFLAYVNKFKTPKAKAALIKNKAIQVIKEFSSNNPAYYEKLWERLQKIIQEEEERRKKDANYFTSPNLYEEIYQAALNEDKERKKVFGDYPATPFEFAVYGELQQIKDNPTESIKVTKSLFLKLYLETRIVGWKTKTSTEKNMKSIIYDTLSENDTPENKIGEISEKIITLAKNRL